MSRYVNVLNTGRSAEECQAIISEYLQAEGFKYIDERAEMVWRKGTGALANPQFIKADVSEGGTVRIEAWTAGVSLVPGVYTGELDPMQGAYGFGPKLALKPRVQELERRLGGASVESNTAGVPAGWYADPTGRHELRYWDNSRWTANVADGGEASMDPQGV